MGEREISWEWGKIMSTYDAPRGKYHHNDMVSGINASLTDLFDFHNNPMRQVLLSSPLIHKETEALEQNEREHQNT